MGLRTSIPWPEIHEYLLEIETAATRDDFLRKAVEGIARVVPWDTAVGIFSSQTGEIFFGHGLTHKANEEYNSYYRLHIPFLPELSSPGADSESILHDAICWKTYADSEFTTDFAAPNGIAYSIAKYIPGTRFALSLHRSRVAGAFRESECLTHAILTQHVNKLYSLFELATGVELTHTSEEISDRFPLLSKREAEVLALQSRGLTASEIGSRLFVSERTVETHAAHIYEKLDVRNKREAIEKLCKSAATPYLF